MRLIMKDKVLLLFIYEHTKDPLPEESGICIIAALLRQEGYKVTVICKNVNDITVDDLIDERSVLIGYTTYQFNKNTVNRHIAMIKKKYPEIKSFIGGIYATYSGNEMMEENNAIDFCIRGEGEHTTVELLKAINGELQFSEVTGLTYRSMGRIIENPDRELNDDLDTLPFAARDLLNDGPLTIANIQGSRGCCANCSFCTSKIQWKKWRGRSINNIIDEIEYLKRDYSINVYNFYDNSFEDPDKYLNRIREFASELSKRELNIFYNVYIRADFYKKASDSIMKLLFDTGLRSVEIGIEAANEQDLALYNKKTTVQDNEKIIDFINQYGIISHLDFINFNPYSTIDSIKKNLDFLIRHNSMFNFFSKLNIFPKTSIYEKVVRDELYSHRDSEGLDHYNFVDPVISILCKYIIGIKNDLIVNYDNMFNQMKWLMVYIPLQLSYISNRHPVSNLAAHSLKEYSLKIKTLNTSINALLYNWISDLLKLCTTSSMKQLPENLRNLTHDKKIMESLQTLFQQIVSLNKRVNRLNIYSTVQ